MRSEPVQEVVHESRFVRAEGRLLETTNHLPGLHFALPQVSKVPALHWTVSLRAVFLAAALDRSVASCS
jgi:hypothetical protein